MKKLNKPEIFRRCWGVICYKKKIILFCGFSATGHLSGVIIDSATLCQPRTRLREYKLRRGSFISRLAKMDSRLHGNDREGVNYS